MSLRDQLKHSTKDSHALLDSAIRALDPFEQPDGYRIYLSLMLALHESCMESIRFVETEANIAAHRPLLVDLIKNDLSSLERGDTTNKSLQENVRQKSAKSPSEMWGEAYVMEGSAMGGKLMFRQAEAALPEKFGRTYLQQLSYDAGERWGVFVSALKDAELHGVNGDEAVAAARSLFDDAYAILERVKNEVDKHVGYR